MFFSNLQLALISLSHNPFHSYSQSPLTPVAHWIGFENTVQETNDRELDHRKPKYSDVQNIVAAGCLSRIAGFLFFNRKRAKRITRWNESTDASVKYRLLFFFYNRWETNKTHEYMHKSGSNGIGLFWMRRRVKMIGHFVRDSVIGRVTYQVGAYRINPASLK
jgi:hypothetical protein